MNSAAVPDFVWNFFSRFMPTREAKPSIAQLASTVCIAPSQRQLHMKQHIEPSLTQMTDALITLASEANHIDAFGVRVQIDNELRSIIGKLHAARRKAAHAIYVKTALEE